ncbi:4552_t:CDS:2 [Gigaspora margarita]|uniref:4552_t:CDS:1 n=1 Tax=Gigaspora margarita TaxID=4874 RepID=A0ABN7UQL8_GIGMA|nr:4552_t:CDS:2 [Gigaspora margarita]
MDQPRVENNDPPREDPIVNAAPTNRPEENRNRTPEEDRNCTLVNKPVPGPNVNNNQNPEPLHIVLRKIANAFKEATVGATTTTCSTLQENNLVWPNPNQVQRNEPDVQSARTVPQQKSVNLCDLDNTGYYHEEDAYVLPLSRHQPYSTQRPRWTQKKSEIVAPVVDPRQPVIEVTPACSRRKRGPSVIDQLEPYYVAQDILNTQASVTIGQLLQYPNQRRPPVEPIEDPESEDTFDEFEYEDEILEEAEGYFAKGAPDPAVYLANIEELPARETDPEEETLNQKLEKNLAEAPLEPEEREATLNLLNKEKNIFARNINDLGQMTLSKEKEDPKPSIEIKRIN